MILPRQKIYKFDFFLLIKSLLNLDFFSYNNLIQKRLETKISKFTKINFCTLVPRGRVGLKIILNFIKKKDLNKNIVLMSPFTIFDVVNMVTSENLTPDFIDINKTDYSINFESLKKKINKKTLAVILTHYHIEPLEYKKIVTFCKNKNIYLVEDRAIAFRKAKKKEKLNKKHFIFFSFSPFKFISTINLGAVVTDNLEFHNNINKYKKRFNNKNFLFMFLRIFFMLKFYIASRNSIFLILFNLIKISEILNISNFKNLLKNDPSPKNYKKSDERNYFLKLTKYQTYSAIYQINNKADSAHKERLKRAKIYSKHLKNVKNVFYKKYAYSSKNCYLSFPILCQNRDQLYKHLLKNNLDTSKYFYRDCNQLKIFRKFNHHCPNTKYISDHILMLPVYPNYPTKNIKLICDMIIDFYKRDKV
jgi:dTDP-4-amino-4,6-dideoxygalactose transaminase